MLEADTKIEISQGEIERERERERGLSEDVDKI